MALATSQPLAVQRRSGAAATLALYWHLFSLDAPTVAALWSWSFARAAHVYLPFFAPLLLAVGTWLVYVADRILDGIGGSHARLRERHYFYLRHRRPFVAAGLSITPAFLWVVLTRMAPAVRRENVAVFSLAAVYFLLVHAGRRAERWLSKELAVGIVFAAATAVPAWAPIAGNHRLLLPAVSLFAGLCWLNCVAIERWEDQYKTGSAHWTTWWAGQHLASLAAGIALISGVFSLFFIQNLPLFCLYMAMACAAVLLFWLAKQGDRISALHLRIAVDAALLTPLLFIPWLR